MNSNYWFENKLAKSTYLYAKTVNENVTTSQASDMYKTCVCVCVCHELATANPKLYSCHFPFGWGRDELTHTCTLNEWDSRRGGKRAKMNFLMHGHLFEWHTYLCWKTNVVKSSKYFVCVNVNMCKCVCMYECGVAKMLEIRYISFGLELVCEILWLWQF